MPLQDIRNFFRKEKYGEYISIEMLVKTITSLNKRFHEEMRIKDTERSLFFAGLMIALKDSTFIKTYQAIQKPSEEEQKAASSHLLESHNLNLAILQAITRQITNKVNNHSKEYNWRDRFSFIRNIDYPLANYIDIIKTVEDKIYKPFRMDEKQDVLGRAYKIFLSRAGKVENKNIILTPDHIKSLMVELARLDINDVVIDTCTGSGGFLMESMEQMIDQAKGDSNIIQKIKEERLIGFETDPTLFALACSNMFLHGDGRTNLIFSSSLPDENTPAGKEMLEYIKSLKPTKCIINPPYENNYPILFTIKALEYIEANGKLIIIMPTPTLSKNPNLTINLLKTARLDFVIKMPNNLFSEQNRCVNTSIFGFTKAKHNVKDNVLFYNMQDDGLVSVQHKGRIDKSDKWEHIKQDVIDCINHNKDNNLCQKRPIYDETNKEYIFYGVKKHTASSDTIKLGDLFSYEKGSLASENNIAGKYNFITASETWKTHNNYTHDKEAIVYAVAAGGSLGKCHYVKGKFIASNLCIILTPKDPDNHPINLQFYAEYLNSIHEQIANDIADGTSKLTIDPKDLENYYIKYIALDTQNNFVQEKIKKITRLERRLKKEKNNMEVSLINIVKD